MITPLAACPRRATLGNSAWFGDQLITFLALGDDTDGHFSLLRVCGGPGAAMAPHYHTHEDETIYLLEGTLTVLAGAEDLRLDPGEAITIPRSLCHALRPHTDEVTFLLQYSPAGFERYFHALSAPAEYLGRPPQPTTPDSTLAAAVAARYGCVVTEG